jgi:hypothetical protein
MGASTAPGATRRRARGATGRRTWPYRFELVPLDRLFIDAEYQRPLTSFVLTVVKEFDPAMVGCLIVSERDGKDMAIIDGQTRWAAMGRVALRDADVMVDDWSDDASIVNALRKLEDMPVAPCLVYSGLTREQEAELFSDLQTKRRGMATYLRFRAALVAKKPEAVAIAEIVRGAGFELDVTETPHTVKAIAALERVYRRDPALLTAVMNVIAAAWPDPATEGRTSGDMIGGLAIFMTREKKIDVERLRDRLASTEPRTIRHRANALQEGSGSGTGGRAGYMADAILGVYMRGRTRGVAAA